MLTDIIILYYVLHGDLTFNFVMCLNYALSKGSFSLTVGCCVCTLLCMTHYWFYVINCRGDSFRREFSRLGELRSIVPEHVHVMVLTAMATVSTRKEIIKSLDMQDPVTVSVSPMKGNIHYCVVRKTTLSEAFRPICEKLARQRTTMDRIIVFC